MQLLLESSLIENKGSDGFLSPLSPQHRCYNCVTSHPPDFSMTYLLNSDSLTQHGSPPSQLISVLSSLPYESYFLVIFLCPGSLLSTLNLFFSGLKGPPFCRCPPLPLSSSGPEHLVCATYDTTFCSYLFVCVCVCVYVCNVCVSSLPVREGSPPCTSSCLALQCSLHRTYAG